MYSAHNISTIFRVPRLGCVLGCCASSAFAPAGCWVSYPPSGLRLVSQFLPALLIMERSTMVCCAWQTLSCCASSALLLRTPGLKSDGPAHSLLPQAPGKKAGQAVRLSIEAWQAGRRSSASRGPRSARARPRLLPTGAAPERPKKRARNRRRRLLGQRRRSESPVRSGPAGWGGPS